MKRYLFVTAVVGVVIIACTYHTVRAAALSFFASALASNTYAEVVYKDHAFTVRNGSIDPTSTEVDERDTLPVLILAYKKLLAERSPLFALPGEDLNRLTAALDSLAEQQRIFATEQSDPVSAAYVGTALYPMQFLRATAKLEAARRQFITESTDENASTYDALLRYTVKTLRADLSRYEDAYDALIRDDMPAYGMLGSTIRKSSMEAIFAALNETTRSTQALIMRRALCTHALTFFCDTEDMRLPSIPPPSVIGRTETGLSSHIVEMYGEAKISLDPAIIVRLAKSYCVRPDMQADYAFMRLSRFGNAYTFPTFVGDIVFIQSAAHRDSPYYDFLAESDIERVLVVPATYYECAEGLYEFAAALSVRTVRDFAADFDVSVIPDAADQARIASLQFALEGRVVREEDAIAYVNTLIQAVPQEPATSGVRQALNTLALSYAGRTRGLTEIALAMTNEERGNRNLAARGAEFDTSAVNLFYTRSGFGSLFTLGSIRPREKADFLFPRNSLPKASQPYEYFSLHPHTESFREELISDIRHFLDSHEEPRHE